MGKLRDLWHGDSERAVNAPQPVRVAPGWDVQPEVLPAKPLAPRRRKYVHVRPNNRDAVALPHPGQSYNPLHDDHQDALRVAVRKLERKKTADEKFVAMMTNGRDVPITGNFSADKTWEEEVQERPQKTQKKEKSTEKEECKKKKKKKDKKKKAKKTSVQAARRALPHRRHPKREIALKEADALDDIIVEHQQREKRREAARERGRAAKREKLQVKSFGRHHHTPLALDVAPTDKLVGSLRHLNGGYIHPLTERMKSLEERNLVPARMRHTYNKRKVLKPKGEVRVKRETFGVMPETTF
ncbi:hypothetical protein C3747_1g98 [Trypanosoma cruzi]|uniref:Ribosome biogenesis protein NOP53 n=2 Tax=Trypanosoma cruzi TaxID=5693 RepID=Q4DLE7_TRYCC|nr:hypothetical protein, conserved [Trypanosoma cruzi]EAN93356.1 hypothetical protein, conserved [Trypanosoma cruzi]KAF5225510.1 hypothetical protein ECC02_001274 [Trypanosoma cruzi]KAF8298649.1 putative Nop53 (60S ribosomal biogenesis) [Trypanosoma cruzi]PWV21881.1 hypothetical protein C3747_1g98 [Trypanosoma cruzi]RNC62124.1 hypothetical protein TcCL_ESM00140 [Trypanosoma cruzi]|eukprot:XP_815207.1 hypothetical protein [Trypanosoma cruzi strain CL Brener]